MKNHRSIVSLLPLALVCAMGCGTSPARAAESDPQEAAITKAAEAFVEAFQKGDAKAVAASWAEDGDYVDLTGRHLQGRPAIENAFKDFFTENKGLKLRIDVNSVHFVTPDIAIEDGITSINSGRDGEGHIGISCYGVDRLGSIEGS